MFWTRCRARDRSVTCDWLHVLNRESHGSLFDREEETRPPVTNRFAKTNRKKYTPMNCRRASAGGGAQAFLLAGRLYAVVFVVGGGRGAGVSAPLYVLNVKLECQRFKEKDENGFSHRRPTSRQFPRPHSVITGAVEKNNIPHVSHIFM